MIKKAVAVNSDGKISMVFTGASDELIKDNTSTDDTVLFVEPPEDRSDYWSFVHNSWISTGYQPTDHHMFNYSTKVWEDFWTTNDYLNQVLVKIKVDADNATYGGFSYKGKTIQSDLRSQSVIQSIIVDGTIDWITADNSVLKLSKDEFDELRIQLSVHLQTVRAHYNDLKNNLHNYTVEQLKDLLNA